jgi:hypothetical protein
MNFSILLDYLQLPLVFYVFNLIIRFIISNILLAIKPPGHIRGIYPGGGYWTTNKKILELYEEKRKTRVSVYRFRRVISVLIGVIAVLGILLIIYLRNDKAITLFLNKALILLKIPAIFINIP